MTCMYACMNVYMHVYTHTTNAFNLTSIYDDYYLF